MDPSTIDRRRLLRIAAAATLSGVGVLKAEGASIRVGGSLPLTGPLASVGLIHKLAGEVFVAEINARGGLLGRPVQWLVLDDQSQASNTRTLYERLISSDKVDLLMGPYGTGSILAALGVAQRGGKLFIQSSLGDPTLSHYDRQFPALPLGPNPRVADNEIIFDGYAATPNPPKTVAIVTSKFPSPLDIAGAAREIAAKRGLKEVLYLDYEFGTKDFGPIASRVKDAGADLLWMGAIGIEGNQFLEAAQRLSYVPPRHFYLFPAPGPMAGNPAAENATSLTWFEEHAPFTANPGAAEFIAQYDAAAVQARFPYPHAEYQAGVEFAAWQILEAAVVGSKGIDDAAMADWLRNNEVPTVLGRQSFKGPNNSGPAGTMLKQLQGGVWSVVYPPAFRAPGRGFVTP